MKDLSGKPKRNPKRRLIPEYAWTRDVRIYETLARQARYVGSSRHKLNPGEFHLNPPATPNQNAMLCDVNGGLTDPGVAQDLLEIAFRKGMVDERTATGNWPLHVWGVWNGIVFEGKWGGNGEYHGYPLEKGDVLRERILDEWGNRDARQ